MFERYTEQARRTLFFARYEASAHGNRVIDAEHLVLGIIREGRGPARRVLDVSHRPADELPVAIITALGSHDPLPTNAEIPFSPACKRVLHLAADEADRLQHSYIGAEHLLLGVLREGESPAARLLVESGVTLDGAREIVASAEPEPERAAEIQVRRGTHVVSAVEGQIRGRELELKKAIVARDGAAISKILAPDFCRLGAVAEQPLVRLSREAWLESLEDSALVAIHLDEIHVTVFGDSVAVAAVRFREFTRSPDTGEPSGSHFLSTDVWVSTSQGWLLAERHTSARQKP